MVQLLVWKCPLKTRSVVQIVQDEVECHLMIRALPWEQSDAAETAGDPLYVAGLTNKEWEVIISSTCIYCLLYMILYLKKMLFQPV